MNNILPVLKNSETLTYQRALGIISCLVAMDSRTNTSWTMESLYQAIAKSVEQGCYQVCCNSFGQPESIHCWQIDRKHPYLCASPFADSENNAPPVHINPESYDFYRYLGNAFELLSFSDYHKMIHIEYIQREILPPAWYQQLMVYYDERNFPWAFFSWARISSVIEERIRHEKAGLMWADWNGGERLYVNDLAAPWGGSRYVIRDMRERIFPHDKGAKAIRRKAELMSGRPSHFKVLRAEMRLDTELVDATNTFVDGPGMYDDYQKVIALLDEFKSRYELASLLDQNNACAAQELKMANELYYQARSKLQPILEEILAHKEQRAADYLALETVIVPFSSSFIRENRLTEWEVRIIREWVTRVLRLAKQSKVERQKDSHEYCRLEYQEVIRFFRQTFLTYLPGLAATCDEMLANIQLDLRATVDKIDRPFARQRGNRLPTYISVPFNGSAEGSIDLIHELSHALLYAENSQNAGYLFVEDRPLINEVFAFLGEYLYLAYLRQFESSHSTRSDFAERVKNRYYFEECMPFLEKALAEGNTAAVDYCAVYPVARKIAYSLAQGVVAGQHQSIERVSQMCRLGGEFSFGSLLLELLPDNEGNSGGEYRADI
ncbi:toxin-activating lysine-acyltransferase [Photobacterium sp. 2_MG-2023]|uniref:toxin-activating lysine-acyltransferase n=1 Tax=Photobacterium sp. 2_MG-2023 TaxID=3062663 RepID=UPI0026E45C13|nr:toxin-activating lysine-acyltransferase [Photobacterium sp. 2_MG-2023]MDO6581350.1 toxin-activating lysine-acyltransferase [Photobacterium sp. 2_MG-2023]